MELRLVSIGFIVKVKAGLVSSVPYLGLIVKADPLTAKSDHLQKAG